MTVRRFSTMTDKRTFNIIINFLNKYKFYFLFLLIGITIFFFPMFLSGFDLMPSDGYEIKSYGYILEHSWLWLNKIEPHNSFWTLPIYEQFPNSLAFGDSLMGIIPFYWLIRIFTNSPFSALQVLLILLCIVNYSTFYYFSKKTFNFSDLSSSISSFVFAFSLIRCFQIENLNYFSQFLSILAIVFLLKIKKENSRLENHKYFILFSLFLIMQFYTCFTLGFFSVFGIILTVLISFLPKLSRDKLIYFFKTFYDFILFYCLVIILSLIPLSYFFTSTETMKTIQDVVYNIHSWQIWIRNVSFLDNLFFNKMTFVAFPLYKELSVSFGIFTTILGIIGLFIVKKVKDIPIILSFSIFCLSCNFIAINIWKFLYYFLFGSEKIDSVSKIAFIGLIIISLSIGFLLEYFKNNTIKTKKITNLLLVSTITLIILEHIPLTKSKISPWSNFNWSKKEFQQELQKQSEKIDSSCENLLFSYMPENIQNYSKNDIKIKEHKKKILENTLGMWISLENNITTTNGYIKIFKDFEKQADNTCKLEEKIDFDKI